MCFRILLPFPTVVALPLSTLSPLHIEVSRENDGVEIIKPGFSQIAGVVHLLGRAAFMLPILLVCSGRPWTPVLG